MGRVRTITESIRENSIIRKRGIIQHEMLLNETYKKHKVKNKERKESVIKALCYNSSLLPSGISEYKLNELIKEGNETAKEWMKEWNIFERLYNQSHIDIDNELKLYGINYKRYYNNVKYYHKKVYYLCGLILYFGFILIIIRRIYPIYEELKLYNIFFLFFLILPFKKYMNILHWFWNYVHIHQNSWENFPILRRQTDWFKIQKRISLESIKILKYLLILYIIKWVVNNYSYNNIISGYITKFKELFNKNIEYNNSARIFSCYLKMKFFIKYYIPYFYPTDEEMSGIIVYMMMKKYLIIIIIIEVFIPLIIISVYKLFIYICKRRKKNNYNHNLTPSNDVSNVLTDKSIENRNYKNNKKNKERNEDLSCKVLFKKILYYGVIIIIYCLILISFFLYSSI